MLKPKSHRPKFGKLIPKISARAQGYDKRWEAYRRIYLREHPFCVDPDKRHRGKWIPATIIDHKIPHRGNVVLFWDRKNHQALCIHCHAAKTAMHDGGFGNPVRKTLKDSGDGIRASVSAVPSGSLRLPVLKEHA